MSVNPIPRPVIAAIKARYSPYLFSSQPVENEKLTRCLEAARWSASSFNDQPWSWIVATRRQPDEFAKMLGVLAEPNQAWAGQADVLMISVARTRFRYNDSPNRVALHDLGGAAALMSLQAAELGLQIHQMAGIDASLAASTYQVPEHHEVVTAIAMGYPHTGPVTNADLEPLRSREQKARQRMPLAESVFTGRFGDAPSWIANDS